MSAVVAFPGPAPENEIDLRVQRWHCGSLPPNAVPLRPLPVLKSSPGPQTTLLTAIVAAMPVTRQREIIRHLRRLSIKGDETADQAISICNGFYGVEQ